MPKKVAKKKKKKTATSQMTIDSRITTEDGDAKVSVARILTIKRTGVDDIFLELEDYRGHRVITACHRCSTLVLVKNIQEAKYLAEFVLSSFNLASTGYKQDPEQERIQKVIGDVRKLLSTL